MCYSHEFDTPFRQQFYGVLAQEMYMYMYVHAMPTLGLYVDTLIQVLYNNKIDHTLHVHGLHLYATSIAWIVVFCCRFAQQITCSTSTMNGCVNSTTTTLRTGHQNTHAHAHTHTLMQDTSNLIWDCTLSICNITL